MPTAAMLSDPKPELREKLPPVQFASRFCLVLFFFRHEFLVPISAIPRRSPRWKSIRSAPPEAGCTTPS